MKVCVYRHLHRVFPESETRSGLLSVIGSRYFLNHSVKVALRESAVFKVINWMGNRNHGKVPRCEVIYQLPFFFMRFFDFLILDEHCENPWGM
jgi:hypothetical protein